MAASIGGLFRRRRQRAGDLVVTSAMPNFESAGFRKLPKIDNE
jgi:hypothetical protein